MGEIFDPGGYDATNFRIEPSDPAYIRELSQASRILGRLYEYKTALVLESEGLIKGSRISDVVGKEDDHHVDIVAQLPDSKKRADDDDTVNIQVKGSPGRITEFRRELRKWYSIRTEGELDQWLKSNRLIVLDASEREKDLIDSFKHQLRSQTGSPRDITIYDSPDRASQLIESIAPINIDDEVNLQRESFPLLMSLKRAAQSLRNVINGTLPNGGLVPLSEKGFYTGWYYFSHNGHVYSSLDETPRNLLSTHPSNPALYLPDSGENWAAKAANGILSKKDADHLATRAKLDNSPFYRRVLKLPAEMRIQALKDILGGLENEIVTSVDQSVEHAFPIFAGYQVAKEMHYSSRIAIKNYFITSGINLYEYQENMYVISCKAGSRQGIRFLYIPREVVSIFAREGSTQLSLEELRALYRQHVDPAYVDHG